MGDALLRFCKACDDYTLKQSCPRCGKPARPNRPAKFSPEDHYGEYRRKLKQLDAAKKGGGLAGPDGNRPPAK